MARPYGSSVKRGPTIRVQGILGGQARQDRVIGGDRGDLALLQQHQAVGPVRYRDRDRVRGRRRDVADGGGSGGGTDLLAAEIADAFSGRAGLHQDPLARVVVDGGEISRWSRLQLMVIVWATMSTAPDWMSGIRWASEMALYWTLFGLPKIAGCDRAHHVDVEPLDLAGEGVEVAEVVGVLVHAGDEVAAGPDPGHEGARGHLRRPGGRRLAVGSHAGSPRRRGRPAVAPGGCHRRGPAATAQAASAATASSSGGSRAASARRLHRYSASRWLSPRAQPAAMTSDAR